MKRKWPSGLYGVSSLIIGPPFPPAPLIATSTTQSEGNILRKCLDSFSRQSTSVALCSSCPVPFQGASVLPVAHTRPYNSTREKQPWQSIGLAVVQKCSVLMWLSIYGEKSTSRLCAWIDVFVKFGHIYL